MKMAFCGWMVVHLQGRVYLGRSRHLLLRIHVLYMYDQSGKLTRKQTGI